jgi:hypothetical protein
MKNLFRCLALSALALPLIASAESFTGSGSLTDTSGQNNDLSFTGLLSQPTFSFSGGDGYVYTDGLTVTAVDSECQRNCSANDGSVSITFNLTSPNPAIPGGGAVTFTGDVNGHTIHWDSNVRSITFSDGWSLLIALTDLNLQGWHSETTLSGSEDVTMTVVDPPVAAPEPSGLTLLGTGIFAAAGLIRRKLTI